MPNCDRRCIAFDRRVLLRGPGIANKCCTVVEDGSTDGSCGTSAAG